MYDVVIIGSGPAGLSASIYAKRAGLKAVTLEQNPMSGGQVLNTYEVDNYPGLPGINGFELGMKFREHADKLECEFKEAAVLGVKRLTEAYGAKGSEIQAASLKERAQEENTGFVVLTSQGEIKTKAVIAAMGATHAKLHIPGEEKLAGKGVSYCATCDGAFFRGKVTAVIGGGDVAVEDAIFLARGCEKVYLIHRRNELRAAAILQKEMMALPNVEILWDTVAKEIAGEEGVQSLLVKNVKTGREQELAVDGVFVAVGIIPSSNALGNMAVCDEKGYLIAGEDCITSVPGLFAAGDVRRKKLRQIITAAADGANAVTSVLEYLA
ncbi:NAD(P)/FAD-dependent oxidoreductase [Parablautia muri]|uniref:FAD-dependent oxidoreductase n=1 Tax=Parablautia muri TaxID=2320879 RepID=A0A9X5BEN4_9FIRM|nr:FAD-dependent oxidoreductase [Parablautia muri]NBJ92339.1 FAD-dependent oxidoreductase [Parablautia muri]